MRFISGTLYGLAAAAGAGRLAAWAWIAGLVALGTVCAIAALEHIIKDALSRPGDPWGIKRPITPAQRLRFRRIHGESDARADVDPA